MSDKPKTKVGITVTLTDANIKEAVAQWLNQQGAIGELAFWQPDDVTISTEEYTAGSYPRDEYTAHRAKIEARK